MMGWDVPEMYIECGLRTSSERAENWYLTACPWNIFGALELSKSFLLGHGKYGPQPGWEPARELKGFPETTSDEVRRLVEGAYHEVGDATWLTLPELESIDLTKPLGLPDNIDWVLRSPTRYFNFTARTDDGHKYLSGSELNESVVRSAVEGEAQIKQDDRTIHAKQVRRDDYAGEFKKMLRFMQDLAGGTRYETYSTPPEQIRLLVWADKAPLSDSSSDHSEPLFQSLYRQICTR